MPCAPIPSRLWASLKFAKGLRVQVDGTRGHDNLPGLNEIAIRVAHVAPQFRGVDFRLGDEFRASRRPKIVVASDISHAKVQKVA
jgi:hypothetical protein